MTILQAETASTQVEIAVRDTLALALRRRYPAVADVSTLQAWPTLAPDGSSQFDESNVELVPVTSLGKVFRWSATSTAADDAATVIAPTDRTGPGLPGRWLVTSAAVSGGFLDAVRLYEGEEEELSLLDRVVGVIPSAWVVWRGEDCKLKSVQPGALYEFMVDLEVWVSSRSMRRGSEALIGSSIADEAAFDPGVLGAIGQVRKVLAGSDLGIGPGVDYVQLGRHTKKLQSLAEGQFVHALAIRVKASFQVPDAPGEDVPVGSLTLSHELVEAVPATAGALHPTTLPLHGPVAANAASNIFPDVTSSPPAPFTQPGGTFQVLATFDPGWDAGDVTIFGLGIDGGGINETLAAVPGGSTSGVLNFASVSVVTSATVGASTTDYANLYNAADPSQLISGPQLASAAREWSGPFIQPLPAYQVAAVFGVGWDGGSIVVEGVDQNGEDTTQTLASQPGGMSFGGPVFTAIAAAYKVIDPNNPTETGISSATVTLFWVTETASPSMPSFDPLNCRVSGLDVVPVAGTTMDVRAGAVLIAGASVQTSDTVADFGAAQDTYRDVSPLGIVVLTSVVAGSVPPPLGAGSLRVGVTRTDAQGFVSDTWLAGSARVVLGADLILNS